MAIYELTLRKDGKDVSRFRVGDRPMVLGRSSSSDIVLPDRVISRHHAKLQVVNGALHVEDLGSTNGIVVNGELVRHRAIKEGDEIFLAKYTVLVERRETQQKLSDTSSFISYENSGSLVERIAGGGSAGHLPTLYRAAQLLGARLDQDDLLARILDLVFETVEARRGFIMIRTGADEQPSIRASRFTGKDTESLPLSQTLIEYVFLHKTAVLTTNADSDERFSGADSIFSYGIKSAMCAPLCGHDDIIGALYVDGEDANAEFSHQDLELLTAIGRVVGVAVENLWFNERQMKNERLAALGEAIAGISHCMRNVLMGLKADEEFIDDALDTGDIEDVRHNWREFRSGIDKFEKIVLDLLSFSRDSQPAVRPCDLDALIEEVLAVVRPLAEQSNVALRIPPDPAGVVLCDHQQIYRVLLNLTLNAVDACRKKADGQVSIVSWRNEFGLYIEVEDNGAGISANDLPRITEAFFTTKGSRGTGLGLACSKKLVEAHGGRLLVESAEGEGSTFTVFLPSEQHLPLEEHGEDVSTTAEVRHQTNGSHGVNPSNGANGRANGGAHTDPPSLS